METGKPTGMMLLYGVAIGQALFRGSAKDDDLLDLREQAQTMLKSHGDLTAALEALDEEIARRGIKSAPPAVSSAAGFFVNIALPLTGEQKARVETAINKAVMNELASHDAKGDLVATPLSQIKSFGANWPGGATAGMWVDVR